MNKNFVIQDAATLDVGGVYVDLHNDFDLCDVSITFGDKRVLFRFELHADARSLLGPKNIYLEIAGLSFLSIAAGTLGLQNRDVAEIGYKAPGDFDHDWLAPESKADEKYHLFVRLAGDDFVRVYGEFASVSFVQSVSTIPVLENFGG